mgnify:CR=1 FL=1
MMSTDAEGNQVPFEQLHVLIDSHREIPEAFEENNGAVMPRVDVLPVDPALFSSDSDVVVSGALINLAGEGLGPEPGKVLISMNGIGLYLLLLPIFPVLVRPCQCSMSLPVFSQIRPLRTTGMEFATLSIDRKVKCAP